MLQELHGILSSAAGWTIAGALLLALALGVVGARFWIYAVLAFVLMFGLGAPPWAFGLLFVVAAIALIPPIRRALISRPVMMLLDRLKVLPVISETERVALEAGTVWVDGDLFSGQPNMKRLAEADYPGLSEEEKAFLDGPVETVCRMTDDWEVNRIRDLPPEVWTYLKEQKFFGMIIPKDRGGLGFSASANSAVVAKLGSRSMTLAITVMVPNSLGPAELLVHYGTDAQKDYYLPRLARGEEVPCFALTEPGAGSDAGSITSSGEVFRGADGKLYLRLSWNKRYITLAAVSTVLGLAFKLRDPDELLEKGQDLGITCALIPTNTPGVVLGKRHDPMGVPFFNCPTMGRDVVVPIDTIIGGVEGAGQGWRMLMESLAAGRGISLPATSTAGAKFAARVAGAYAAVRRQFGLPIGKFEGIEEPLARIGGAAYTLEAARRFTCGALDKGAKPAVVTAIAKYTFTEICRSAINDAMDILGGAGISRGPRNLMAGVYTAMPISVTVEGANILTRTLVVFGQGAIRCHPFAYREVKALGDRDAVAFDQAFFGHIGHVFRNACRVIVFSVTRGRLARSPVGGPAAPYYRKLAWASASFALLSDVAMGLMGGDLKRREALTGRFADVFAWLYMGTAVLRRFEAEGRRAEDLPFLHWSMQNAFDRIQNAFEGLLQNFGSGVLGWLFRGPMAMWLRLNRFGRPPADAVAQAVAQALQSPSELRDRVTSGLYVPTDEAESLGRLEHALVLAVRAEGVLHKIKQAIRKGQLPRRSPALLLETAEADGIISSEERALVREAEAARDDAIQVDAFTLDEYMEMSAHRASHRGLPDDALASSDESVMPAA
ncbi:MAG: acyl-CoA dehydrogenase [Deltaproteobacteria bacterium]|nr:acyl-CoA dehydrogenase [Deltaproteobacteria bacterium]